MPFFFALTNDDLVASLKHEMSTVYPQWRLSFSAGGFITFKGEEGAAWPSPRLARFWGESYPKNAPVPEDAYWIEVNGQRWPVNPHTPQPWWPSSDQTSGLELPGDAPSRAWLKIEEAIRLFDLPIGEGDCVLEVGASPGGACWALLNRGVQVIGVDPAAMDPLCLQHPWFTHLRKPFQELTELDVKGVDWWLSDLNLAPGSVLSHLGRLLRGADRPKGLVLTLKLAKPEVAVELAQHEDRVRSWGYRTQVRLLPSNHKEVVLVALAK